MRAAIRYIVYPLRQVRWNAGHYRHVQQYFTYALFSKLVLLPRDHTRTDHVDKKLIWHKAEGHPQNRTFDLTVTCKSRCKSSRWKCEKLTVSPDPQVKKGNPRSKHVALRRVFDLKFNRVHMRFPNGILVLNCKNRNTQISGVQGEWPSPVYMQHPLGGFLNVYMKVCHYCT